MARLSDFAVTEQITDGAADYADHRHLDMTSDEERQRKGNDERDCSTQRKRGVPIAALRRDDLEDKIENRAVNEIQRERNFAEKAKEAMG